MRALRAVGMSRCCVTLAMRRGAMSLPQCSCWSRAAFHAVNLTARRHASNDPLRLATAQSCLQPFYMFVVFPAPSLQSTITGGLCAVSLSVCRSVFRCRSLPHPSYQRANHDRTSCITMDALLTRLVTHVRGVLGVPPTFEWAVRVGVVAPTAPDQRAALVELFIATNGSTWTSKTGWQDYATGSDPCDNSWSGVGCSGSSGSANRNV
jgi:hypothetical protein